MMGIGDVDGAGVRGAGRGVAGLPVLVLLLLFGALGAGPAASPLEAQRLSTLDYEDLSPRGVMLDIGWVRPGRVNPTGSFGGRVDLGFLGPGVRATIGAARWSSTLRRSEVQVFESQIADLIETETGTRPEVNLGEIRWSDVAISGDAHLLWRVPGGFLTYLGGGATAHLMRGGGDAIDGTFVEDLLNTIRAGANVHAGLEFPLSDQLRIVGESRFEVVQSVSHLRFRAGLQYMWGPPAPGERR